MKAGSELDEELKRLPSTSMVIIGTKKMPGVFFSDEVAPNEHAWGYVLANKTPPAAKATNDLTGFFDRQRLDLSYIDGRVALLGDSAHPQSPSK